MNRVEFESWKERIDNIMNESADGIIGLSQIKGDVGTHNNRTPDEVKRNNDRKAKLKNDAEQSIAKRAMNKASEVGSKAVNAVKQGAKTMAQKTVEGGKKIVNTAKEILKGKEDKPIGLSQINKQNKDSGSKETPKSEMANKFAKGVGKAQPKATTKAGATATNTNKKTDTKDSNVEFKTKAHINGNGGKDPDNNNPKDTKDNGKKELRSTLAQKLKHGAKKLIHAVNDTKHKIDDAKRFVKDTYDSRDKANKRVRGIKDEDNKSELKKKAEEAIAKGKETKGEGAPKASRTSSGRRHTTININVNNSGSSKSKVQQAQETANEVGEVHAERNKKAEEEKKAKDNEFREEGEKRFNKAVNKAKGIEEPEVEEPNVEGTNKPEGTNNSEGTNKPEGKKQTSRKTNSKNNNNNVEGTNNPEGTNTEVKSTEKKQESKADKLKKETPQKIINPQSDNTASEEEMEGMKVKKLAAGNAEGSNTLQHKKTKGKEASMYDYENGKPVPATPADKPKNEAGERTSAKAIIKKKNGETKKVEAIVEQPKAEVEQEENKEVKPEAKAETNSEEPKAEDKKAELAKQAEQAKQTGKRELTPEEREKKRQELHAKQAEESQKRYQERKEQMANAKGGHEDTRSDEERAKDNKDIMTNKDNPNHVEGRYKLSSLDGSKDPETGREDGKAVDKDKFYTVTDAQNKKIDNETEAEKAKRNAGSTRASNNAADNKKKEEKKAKSEGEKNTDRFIDSILNSEDDEPSDDELNKIERKNKKK